MKALFTILFLLTFTGCLPKLSTTGLHFSAKNPLSQNVEAEKTFSSIFKTQCLECHTKTWNDPERMDRWLNALTPKESKIFKSVESGKMPKGKAPLNTLELEIFLKYISHYQVRTKILEPKCLECHTKTLGDEERFARWIVPGKPEESRLYLSVKSGKMPKGKPPLSEFEIEVLKNYILNL